MANIRRSGFQHRGPRRPTDWGVGPSEIGTDRTSSQTFIWSTGTTPAANLTLIRTRGWVNYYLTAVDAIGSGFSGASGIYMMTEDAFLTGNAAALDPVVDANSDMWIWHSFFDVRAITATIGDGVNAQAVVQRQMIDSKAMRKEFDPERVMVGVTEIVEIGTCTMSVFAECRQLFKS